MCRILVVEDEKLQRELYALELKDEGYDVDGVADGKDALEKIKKTKYNIIILDIRMPGMDGVETISKIHSIDKNASVIIYSAYSNYKSNYLTWTSDAYVIKSSDLKELKEKIKEILSLKARN